MPIMKPFTQEQATAVESVTMQHPDYFMILWLSVIVFGNEYL